MILYLWLKKDIMYWDEQTDNSDIRENSWNSQIAARKRAVRKKGSVFRSRAILMDEWMGECVFDWSEVAWFEEMDEWIIDVKKGFL